MQETIFLYKILPWIIYTIGLGLGVFSGVLVYSGLSSQTERIQTRLRIRHNLYKTHEKLKNQASQSKAEKWLKEADYPLGINSFKYHLIYFGTLGFLVVYYLFLPFIREGQVSIVALLSIIVFSILFLPAFPYSIFVFMIKRVKDYRIAKRNAEIFMLYELLINELEMMNNTRINTYNILRNILPSFDIISNELNKLLSNWSSEGPNIALDKFAKSIDTKEARSLISIIKTLDDVDRKTAIESLKGLNTMFVRSQIENYRRRKKITTDLAAIPIKATHFIIILNFLVIIILMTLNAMNANRL